MTAESCPDCERGGTGRPIPGQSGRVECSVCSASWDRLRWKDPRQRLAFYYAGAIACGDESSGHGNAGTKGDFDYADEVLDRYPPDGRRPTGRR